MAYILRSLAVIGVIALNSPVHGEKPDDGGHSAATVRSVARTAAQIDAHGAMSMTTSSITAAREAAQILAGLDPATRERLMAITAAAAASRSEGRERSTGMTR
ncbi:MAG TPA: hypothetical protein VGN82_19115 [Bosea sp. (in: a-proteobacteria)]|jgi:hypothetical protein|uniref:hypothetical protein n=1 Tax=Bosea sp. (in: a-proteobacteria) TaxID=1871050 RepID=UPI002E0E4BE4|nr:hypothetical protein [Bosea sp. (in: a-proteobacteria)]